MPDVACVDREILQKLVAFGSEKVNPVDLGTIVGIVGIDLRLIGAIQNDTAGTAGYLIAIN